ncbi:hypothetical protein E4T79_04735 [Streptococcus sp. LYSM12]|nr:hypothetical protein E4T79_04735 [Streptococcus sp. LYSM12]
MVFFIFVSFYFNTIIFCKYFIAFTHKILYNSIVVSFIFYYFVNLLCRTLVQPAARCLVLKAN